MLATAAAPSPVLLKNALREKLLGSFILQVLIGLNEEIKLVVLSKIRFK
jgi:hypothetical protein